MLSSPNLTYNLEKFENYYFVFWNALHRSDVILEQALLMAIRKAFLEYIYNLAKLNEKLQERLIAQIKLLMTSHVLETETAMFIMNDLEQHSTQLKLLIKNHYEDDAKHFVNSLNEHVTHECNEQLIPSNLQSGMKKPRKSHRKYQPKEAEFKPREFIARGFNIIRNGKLNYGIKVIESVIPMLDEKSNEDNCYLLQVYFRLARQCIQKGEYEKWNNCRKKALEVGNKISEKSSADEYVIEYFQQDAIKLLSNTLMFSSSNMSMIKTFVKNIVNDSPERLGDLLNNLPSSMWLTFSTIGLDFASIIKSYDDFVKLWKLINEKDKKDFTVIFDTFKSLTDEKGNTLLHCAAEKNQLDVLKWLLMTAKVDINAKNKANQSSLDLAKSINTNKTLAAWLEGYMVCDSLAKVLGNVVLDSSSAIDEFHTAVMNSFEVDAKLSSNPLFVDSIGKLRDVIKSYHQNYEKIAIAYIKNYTKNLINLTGEQKERYIVSQKQKLNLKSVTGKMGLFDKETKQTTEISTVQTQKQIPRVL